MSLFRKNPRRDNSEKAIVEALRAAGAIVLRASGAGMPDLLIHYRGRWTVLEVKSAKGKLTIAQQNTRILAPFPVARTPSEALAAIGVTLR